MFFGDHRSTENPRQFLESIKASFIAFPGISKVEKCLQFYNLCRLGSDTEEWYETLQECDSDTTTWAQLVAKFRYKWKWSFPHDTHGNLIYSSKPTYLKKTMRTPITIPAITTIPAPTATATISMTNTAANTIHETTTTPQPLNQTADTQHVERVPSRSQVGKECL